MPGLEILGQGPRNERLVEWCSPVRQAQLLRIERVLDLFWVSSLSHPFIEHLLQVNYKGGGQRLQYKAQQRLDQKPHMSLLVTNISTSFRVSRLIHSSKHYKSEDLVYSGRPVGTSNRMVAYERRATSILTRISSREWISWKTIVAPKLRSCCLYGSTSKRMNSTSKARTMRRPHVISRLQKDL